MMVESFDRTKYHPNIAEIIKKTIYNNPYILFKPYPRQLWPLFEINQPIINNEPHTILTGGGGYGGKTYLGTICAGQFLEVPDYSCLVTRLNYAELTGEDSIWENSIEWFCDESRLGELTCKYNESKLRITSPSGAKIWFKAFDHVKKKQKVKSESYHRIVNDEASELNPEVLQFLYRSLRSSLDSFIPLAMINFSNPGGDATKYLRTRHLEGRYSYYWIDWRHNPFIPKKVYSKTLNNLSFADKKYQKDGDWYYTPSSGEMFNLEQIENATITPKMYHELLGHFSIQRMIRGWDIATTKRKTSDYTASSLIDIFSEDIRIIKNQTSFQKLPGTLELAMQTVMNNDGHEIEQWIESYPVGGEIIDRYWINNEFKEFNVKMIHPFKNKVVRAGSVEKALNNINPGLKEVFPDLRLPDLLFIEDTKQPYLEMFGKQAVNFPPDKHTDEEETHDDRVDSVSVVLYNLKRRPNLRARR